MKISNDNKFYFFTKDLILFLSSDVSSNLGGLLFGLIFGPGFQDRVMRSVAKLVSCSIYYSFFRPNSYCKSVNTQDLKAIQSIVNIMNDNGIVVLGENHSFSTTTDLILLAMLRDIPAKKLTIWYEGIPSGVLSRKDLIKYKDDIPLKLFGHLLSIGVTICGLERHASNPFYDIETKVGLFKACGNCFDQADCSQIKNLDETEKLSFNDLKGVIYVHFLKVFNRRQFDEEAPSLVENHHGQAMEIVICGAVHIPFHSAR